LASGNDGSQLSARFPISLTTNSHRDITNRNQPLLFFLMDPTNSIVWTRKSFIGSVVSCRVGFQQNSGQKSVMDPSCQHNFRGHQQPMGHNKQESTTLFFHMDPTNSITSSRCKIFLYLLQIIMRKCLWDKTIRHCETKRYDNEVNIYG
jgi:hypothetical protein